MDLLQSLHRSEIHNFTSLSFSHPANGAIPFRIWELRLLGFPFTLCLARHLSYKPSTWISFTDSTVCVRAFGSFSTRTHASPPSDTSDAHPVPLFAALPVSPVRRNVRPHTSIPRRIRTPEIPRYFSRSSLNIFIP